MHQNERNVPWTPASLVACLLIISNIKQIKNKLAGSQVHRRQVHKDHCNYLILKMPKTFLKYHLMKIFLNEKFQKSIDICAKCDRNCSTQGAECWMARKKKKKLKHHLMKMFLTKSSD